MFELHTETAPAGLAALGQVVELREQACGVVDKAIAEAQAPGEIVTRVLGITLYVDGAPLG